MMNQIFWMGGANVTLPVMHQESRKYGDLTIQISTIPQYDGILIEKNLGYMVQAVITIRYIYEEIDSDDMVVFTMWMDYENIRSNYPWALSDFNK